MGLFTRKRPGLEVRASKSIGGARAGGSSWMSPLWPTVRPAALRADPVVYRCVQAIAGSAASLDLGVESAGELDFDHPVAVLFNRQPNEAMSARFFKETIWQRLELSDAGAPVYVDRGESGTGEPVGLYPIYDWCEIVFDKRGDLFPLGFRVHTERGVIPLLPEEVLYLHYPDPDDPWAHLSPLTAATRTMNLDDAARTYQEAEFRNGGRTSNVVYLGDVDETAATQAQAEFESRHAGPRNAGRALFTWGEKEPKVERMSMTPAEMSFVGSRQLNNEEKFLAFGVSQDLWKSGSTFENRRQAKVGLWTETIIPKLEIVASDVDRQLIPDLALSARFDTSEVDALRENQDSVVSRARSSVYADIATIDEAREQIGLDPLPNGKGAVTLTEYRAQFPRMGNAVGESLRAGGRLIGGPLAVLDPPAIDVRAVEVAVSAEAIQRAYDRLEARGRKAVARLAEKQQRIVLQQLQRSRRKAADFDTRASADDVFDRQHHFELTRDTLEDFVGDTWEAGATQAAKALGLDFDLFDERVTIAMRARLDVLADVVTGTTYEAIDRAILAEGVAAGEGIPDLADRLRSVFDDLSSWRAETIARTETVGGHNASSRLVAVDSGVVTRRRWLSASDARVRDTHAALNGYETQGLEDRYPNGLLHPGDPSGSAEESINCRCVETFVVDDDDEEA